MLKTFRRPETTIRGKEQYERPEDEALMRAFLTTKEMRFFSAVIAKNPELPQAEKVGTVLFLALITKADDAIDEGQEFQERLAPDELKKRLLAYRIPEVDRSIEQLTEIILDHFPEPKQKLITEYLDEMIAYHADKEKTPAGSYSYKDAVEYRSQTNNPLMDVTLQLIGINDPAEHALYRTYGFLFQHGDDAEDWPKDGAEGASNLWIGMATDIAEEHPEELRELQRYVSLSEQERPKGSLKSWMKENMPYTHAAYTEEYRKLLAGTHGGVKMGYRMWGRKTIGRIG